MDEQERDFWASQPLINCHTHIFKGRHVPPYLAKTYLPWPFYHFVNFAAILFIFRSWYHGSLKVIPNTWNAVRRLARRIRLFISQTPLLSFWVFLLVGFLLLQALFFMLTWAKVLPSAKPGLFYDVLRWIDQHLIWTAASGLSKALIIFLLLVFSPAARNILLLLARQLFKFMKMLPGKQSLALMERYILLGRFALYKEQSDVFTKLKLQYPPGTGLIVLPMDMEFMNAGKLRPDSSYHNQMQELACIKQRDKDDVCYPFVFIDPRRIEKEGASFFDWYTDGQGQVILKDCFVKRYIEDHHFNGFKIYPALGYYPFDPLLLPLWKYAEQNQIPILTHCIRGTIYYRGPKTKAWNKHPVFLDPERGENKSLCLPEIKNVHFINNFTHPLNYLCLLDEVFLKRLLASCDQRTQDLFGFVSKDAKLKTDLRTLKICFGHYGGDDEWHKFLESDRDVFSIAMQTHPNRGISFSTNSSGKFSEEKLCQIWRSTDWYSIISSLMMQYPNVYADISYIIHNPDIFPLLKQTLRNPRLLQRVLFGTDFYVVRNHKTEKNLLADLFAGLSAEDIIMIAKKNPVEFLKKVQCSKPEAVRPAFY